MRMMNLSDFNLWQKNFIDSFWSLKSKNDNFLEELSAYHPNYDYDSSINVEEKKRVESAILSRMKNYGRKTKGNFGVVRYSRSPYLDDLFALCASQNISPNDILFDTLKFEIESWSTFADIYSFLKRMTKAEEVLNIFNIENIDFAINKEKIPNDKKFRLAFFYCLLCDFQDIFQIQKTSSGTIKSIHYEYKDKSIVNYIQDEISILSKSDIDYIVNDPVLSYSVCHAKWDYYLSTDYGHDKGFEDFDCLTHDAWNEKKHLLVSLNYYILVSAIKALHIIGRLNSDNGYNVNNKKTFKESLSEHENIHVFLQQIFTCCFIKINQSSAIDWNGIIYPERSDDKMLPLTAHHEKGFGEPRNSLIPDTIINQIHER